jgi:hypothetical protein
MGDTRFVLFRLVAIILAIWIGAAVVEGITYALHHAAVGTANQLVVSR